MRYTLFHIIKNRLNKIHTMFRMMQKRLFKSNLIAAVRVTNRNMKIKSNSTILIELHTAPVRVSRAGIESDLYVYQTPLFIFKL